MNLRDLLGCLRRELAFRERCYPKWVAKGSMAEAKAERELELMRQCVAFVEHCIFKAVVSRKSLAIKNILPGFGDANATDSTSTPHKG